MHLYSYRYVYPYLFSLLANGTSFPRPRKEVLSSEEFLESVMALRGARSGMRSSAGGDAPHSNPSSGNSSDDEEEAVGPAAGGEAQVGYNIAPENLKRGHTLSAIAEVEEAHRGGRDSAAALAAQQQQKLAKSSEAASASASTSASAEHSNESSAVERERTTTFADDVSAAQADEHVARRVKSFKRSDSTDVEAFGFELLMGHYSEEVLGEREDGPPVYSLLEQLYSRLLTLLNSSVNDLYLILDVDTGV